MLGRLLRAIVVLLALVGVLAVVGAAWFVAGGIGARDAPSELERTLARALRSLAIPGSASRRSNPVPASEHVVRHGMEHFADHCAVCHGNNGGGDTMFGRGMYPRPPDLRLDETQNLTDGELFYIIENGVKLTGMPGFGDRLHEGEESSWGLVHFIRHLPAITDEELQQMEMLNPRSPEEWRQMEEERKSRKGEGAAPKPSAKPHIHKQGGQS